MHSKQVVMQRKKPATRHSRMLWAMWQPGGRP